MIDQFKDKTDMGMTLISDPRLDGQRVIARYGDQRFF